MIDYFQKRIAELEVQEVRVLAELNAIAGAIGELRAALAESKAEVAMDGSPPAPSVAPLPPSEPEPKEHPLRGPIEVGS